MTHVKQPCSVNPDCRNNAIHVMWTGVAALALLLLASVAAPGQTKEDCLACHSDNSMSMEREGRQVSLFVDDSVLLRSPHAKLVCVACHAGFDKDNVPHKEAIEPINCLTCHRDAPPRHVFHPQLLVATGLDARPDLSCKGCHGRHDIVSPKVTGSKFSLISSTNSCGACHNGIRNEYLQSAHGRASEAGVAQAPRCLTCHRNPISNKRKSQASAELKLAQARMCLTCHLDDPGVKASMPQGAGSISPWIGGTHGRRLAGGNALAASCADCHGSHTVNRGSDPSSPVSRLNTPGTCGRCHVDIVNQYRQSIHGTLATGGRTDTPGCQDCHAEHPNVARARSATGPAHAATPAQTCITCHPAARVIITTAVNPAFFTAANPGYHGFTMDKDSLSVTNCASCHGAHDIRPKADSASAVNPANIARTCGSCHPDAATRFAVPRIHSAADLRRLAPEGNAWVRPLYLILILVFVGWRLLVNIADWLRRGRRRRALAPAAGTRTFLRMTLAERIQHGLALVSVVALIKTGFVLRFPDAWIVQRMDAWLPFWKSMIEPVHHGAAGLLVLAMLLHLIHILFTHRGRRLLLDLLPRVRDVADAVRHWRWAFGLSTEAPAFGRFAPFEKSTYWFSISGILILTITGILMALGRTALPHIYDLVESVHYYQLWLTTLSILVGHLYFVVFNPDVYPFNRAFLFGTMSELEMSLLHPRELDAQNSERA